MGAKSLSEWVQELPNDIAGVKIRIGRKGRNLPTIAVIALPSFSDEAESRLKEVSPIRILDRDELEELIEEEAAAAGYPETQEILRLHSLSSDGKHRRSFQITAQPVTASSEGAVISRLVDGILKSNAELRKSVDILTESLAHREDVLKDSIDSMLAAQQQAVESEATSLLNMIESAIPAEPENDPLKEQAAGILGQIGQIFTGGAQAPLTADTVADMMASNPEMVKEMLNNDRVKSAFSEAMSNNTPES